MVVHLQMGISRIADLLIVIFIVFFFQYPTWLKEKKTKLGEDDYGRYVRQQELVSRLCCEFEGETENDSDEGKKLRLDRIMDLMQKVFIQFIYFTLNLSCFSSILYAYVLDRYISIKHGFLTFRAFRYIGTCQMIIF